MIPNATILLMALSVGVGCPSSDPELAAIDGAGADAPDTVTDIPVAETVVDAPAADGVTDPGPRDTSGDPGGSGPDTSQPDAPEVPPGPEIIGLAIEPAIPHMGQGGAASVQARVHFSDGASAIVTSEASWTSLTPVTLKVTGPGEVSALAPGEASLQVAWQGATGEPMTFTVYPADRYEARALWVNRWQFSSAEDVEAIMEGASQAGFNLVYFQVRGRFDAFYESAKEPWAKELTGTLGEDPGWDPLAVAIEEAHARGMELHAWINVFTIWSGSTMPTSVGIPHPLEMHPEWRMVDAEGQPMGLESGQYVWASPGIPEVREWNVAVGREILEGYPEVDGLHLDRIRYPGSDWSYDIPSLDTYEAAKVSEPDLSFEDFRRHQVNHQVAEYYLMLETVDPTQVLSAAVAAKYKNIWGWTKVSIGYSDSLQDSRAWMEAGTIDVLCPMAYGAMTDPKGERTDFATLADDWIVDAGLDRHVYMGSSDDYPDFQEIADQLAYVRDLDGPGHVIYHWGGLLDKGYLDALAQGPWSETAVIPWMPWKSQ